MSGTRFRSGCYTKTLLLSAAATLIFSLQPGSCRAGTGAFEPLYSIVRSLESDYRYFYTDYTGLMGLGVGLAAAGVAANSSADREFREYFDDNIKNPFTDGLSDVSRVPGTVYLTIPALAAVRLFVPDTRYGDWADRSLRAEFLGGPLGLLIQRGTGGSRPVEGTSGWKPFKNNNGLSGHSFVGAVPFIAAARMQDGSYMKALFYGLSALPALSRINDGKHYLSQAALGWYLAYLSVRAVDESTEAGSIALSAAPLGADGVVIFLKASF